MSPIFPCFHTKSIHQNRHAHPGQHQIANLTSTLSLKSSSKFSHLSDEELTFLEDFKARILAGHVDRKTARVSGFTEHSQHHKRPSIKELRQRIRSFMHDFRRQQLEDEEFDADYEEEEAQESEFEEWEKLKTEKHHATARSFPSQENVDSADSPPQSTQTLPKLHLFSFKPRLQHPSLPHRETVLSHAHLHIAPPTARLDHPAPRPTTPTLLTSDHIPGLLTQPVYNISLFYIASNQKSVNRVGEPLGSFLSNQSVTLDVKHLLENHVIESDDSDHIPFNIGVRVSQSGVTPTTKTEVFTSTTEQTNYNKVTHTQNDINEYSYNYSDQEPANLQDVLNNLSASLEFSSKQNDLRRVGSGLSRPRRGTLSRGRHGCQRHKIHVKFEDIGFGWVLAPEGYDAHFCSGGCSSWSSYASNFVLTKAMLARRLPGVVPPPVCAASGWGPISLLFFEGGEIHHEYYPGMQVTACECR